MLSASSDLVHAVLETVDVGIVACDAQGRLVLFNETARRFHGATADPSVPVDRWATRFSLYRPDGVTLLPRDEVPLYRALTEGSVRDVELVIAPPGLAPVTVRATGTALHDVEGRLTGAVCAMTDITALRESERRLQLAHDAMTRSESQFRHAFERGPTPRPAPPRPAA